MPGLVSAIWLLSNWKRSPKSGRRKLRRAPPRSDVRSAQERSALRKNRRLARAEKYEVAALIALIAARPVLQQRFSALGPTNCVKPCSPCYPATRLQRSLVPRGGSGFRGFSAFRLLGWTASGLSPSLIASASLRYCPLAGGLSPSLIASTSLTYLPFLVVP